MGKNTLSPILLSNEEEIKKRKLKNIIRKKRILLTKIVTKTEMLRVELDMVKQEYDVRVGSLYLKDNQLDLEIIYLRNVIQLIEQGLSYKDAVEQLNDTYYAKQRQYEQEREQMRQEEQIFKERSGSKAKYATEELRKIWKKLVAKFHPDLVQDMDEKKHREEMMKQINRAYEEHNLDKLKQLEKESIISEDTEHSIEELEAIIIEINKQIEDQNNAYQELRVSEWYSWRTRLKKAKNENYDIFAGIERTLLNDIVRKMDILRKLREKINK